MPPPAPTPNASDPCLRTPPQGHIKQNPRLVMLLPPFGALCLCSVLPLVMYVAYQEDFGNKINPLRPDHYWYLARKTFGALKNNNWKVGKPS